MKDKMLNRNGEEYWFIKLNDNQYQFCMEEDSFSMKYFRIGGREGQNDIDINDLGFFDPSGGPFISVDSNLFGRKIINLAKNNSGFIITLDT